MVQVELFLRVDASDGSQSQSETRPHVYSFGDDAERQTAYYFTEEPASFMHAIKGER